MQFQFSKIVLILLFFFTICRAPAAEPVDPSTLTGKVMFGYQGWFSCEGDGMDLGWTHWARQPENRFGPGNVTVDLWPDLSEFDDDELYDTGFKNADGSPAKVFTSSHPKTVQRHFEWMRDYGIDGVFLQRFVNGLKNPDLLKQKNKVLRNVRDAANSTGRTFAIMYDLSGINAGQTSRIRDDWEGLQELKTMRLSTYQKHKGKPVVALWGIGFNDDRDYTLAECRELIIWLKAEGCTVMLGIPSYWREQIRDATNDPALHEILELADILSPWSVGRYQTPEEATYHGENVWKPDLQWCQSRTLDFLPVVFPGFSWHNLHGGEIDSIPRLGGDFLWSQIVAAKRAGSDMIYVAMFDEVDEGTAIFKCTNTPPVGDGVNFLSYHGLPSDHYLRLTGLAGKLIRDEIPMTEKAP